MIWWLKARGGMEVSAALVAFAALVMFVGGLQFTIPAVLGGGASVLHASTFVAVGVAAALAFAFDTRDTRTEARPHRSVSSYDAGLFVALLTLFCAASAAGAVLAEGAPLQSITTTTILASAAVTVTCLLDAPRGALAATAIFLLTSNYGPHLRGASVVRILQAEANMTVAVTAASLAAVTAVLVLRYGRPITSKL